MTAQVTVDVTRDYTTGEVAKILGVAPRTVAKWVDGGRLPGRVVGPGGRVRQVPGEALAEFLRVNAFNPRARSAPAAALADLFDGPPTPEVRHLTPAQIRDRIGKGLPRERWEELRRRTCATVRSQGWVTDGYLAYFASGTERAQWAGWTPPGSDSARPMPVAEVVGEARFRLDAALDGSTAGPVGSRVNDEAGRVEVLLRSGDGREVVVDAALWATARHRHPAASAHLTRRGRDGVVLFLLDGEPVALLAPITPPDRRAK